MAPSRFTELLQSKTFTNAADRRIVAELYRKTMVDAFGGRTQLRYVGLGWGEAEMEELSATLGVRCGALGWWRLT